jgi:hypothetical protein
VLGHAHLERCCTFNLAELLHWQGSLDEALPLARRSRSLQQRFLGPSPLDALLVARIQAARGELDEARAELAWVDASCGILEGALAMQRALVGLVASGTSDPAAWEPVLAAARATTVLYELPEALWFAARAADAPVAQRWISEARRLDKPDSAWSARFDAIESALATSYTN